MTNSRYLANDVVAVGPTIDKRSWGGHFWLYLPLILLCSFYGMDGEKICLNNDGGGLIVDGCRQLEKQWQITMPPVGGNFEFDLWPWCSRHVEYSAIK